MVHHGRMLRMQRIRLHKINNIFGGYILNTFVRVVCAVIAMFTISSVAASDAPALTADLFCMPCQQPLAGEVPAVCLPCKHGMHINCMLGQLRENLEDGCASERCGIACPVCKKSVSMYVIKRIVRSVERKTGGSYLDETLHSALLFCDAPPSCAPVVFALASAAFIAYWWSSSGT